MKSSEVKNRVLENIKSHKLDCEAKADFCFRKAFLNATFKNIYKEYKSIELLKAKNEFFNKDSKNEVEKLAKLKAQMDEILKAMGLSLSDFEPKYNCLKCKDTGIVGNKYCTCFYKNYNEALIKNLGANIDRSHTFENADLTIFDNVEKTKKIYLKLNEWCDKIETTKKKTLLLSGETGVGKTYLTECICNKLLNKNMVVSFYSSFALNDLFYKYHTAFQENKSGLLDVVMNCDVLIIDDFGSEPKLKTSEEYFYSLFNERSSKKLVTIISTNLSPLEIMDKYGERTFSRLNNKVYSLLIKMENKDLRLNLKN